MAILSVNAGSSTLKFALYPLQAGQVQPCVLSGSIQGLEPQGTPSMGWTHGGVRQQMPLTSVVSHADTFAAALRSLADLLHTTPGLPSLKAVAHRVVHGGQHYVHSVRVTERVLADLAQLNTLAPLHQPNNLQGIRAFAQAFEDMPQVACFDTAFHATLPELACRFALPPSVTDLGVRRYGFHGLSYQFIMGMLQQHSRQAQGRVLMAHLGNGASLCGALDGLSQATTMGFSTLDGLMMGTRCGTLDPGVLLYLLAQGWTAERLETLLYKQSGLLGVSGVSADMRQLRAHISAQGEHSLAAEQAIALFTHRTVREAGALVACLGGLDVLAFSGGIGENDVALRAETCAQLAWLGIRLDASRNQQAVGAGVMAIHAADSSVEVWVVPTDEGLVAAREAAALLQSAGA